ncbi:MAG: rRNA maturation RNase YbeY [Bacteroidota bacterium]
MASITFFYLKQTTVLRNKKRLKSFMLEQATLYGRPIHSLQVICCSDEYLLQMNRDFLKHDYYTDIITFDLGDRDSNQIDAELYISLDRVKENASSLGITFAVELHRVIFHGLLHLLGYKDKTSSDQKIMRLMEERFLQTYFNAP